MTVPDPRQLAAESADGFLPLGTEVSDTELARAAGTDPHAFEQLVARYYPLIFSIARARLGNVETAEDLTQEVVLRLFLKLPELRDSAAFPRWIRQVTRNLASHWEAGARTRSRLLPLISLEELPADFHSSARPDPRALAGGRQEQSILEGALDRLSPALREVVLLHYAEDLSKSEVARLLGMHPSTVGRQLDAALLRLRDILPPSLRESAAPMASSSASRSAPVRAGARRAILLAAAVSSASLETKTALARAAVAGAAAVPGIFPAAAGALAASASSTLFTGGVLMAKGKAAALAVVAAGFLVTAVFQYPRVSQLVSGVPGGGAAGSGAIPAAELERLRRYAAELRAEVGLELFEKPISFASERGETLERAFTRLGQQAGTRIVYKGTQTAADGGLVYNGPFGGALLSLMMTHDQKATKLPDGTLEILPR